MQTNGLGWQVQSWVTPVSRCIRPPVMGSADSREKAFRFTCSFRPTASSSPRVTLDMSCLLICTLGFGSLHRYCYRSCKFKREMKERLTLRRITLCFLIDLMAYIFMPHIRINIPAFLYIIVVFKGIMCRIFYFLF